MKIITSEMIDAFKIYLEENERSKATIQKYLHDIRCFVIYAAGKEISKQTVLNYKNSMVEKYTYTSANSMLAALNAFFKFLEWNDLCVKQYKLQKPIFCNEEREISRSDYMSLLDACSKKKKERLGLIIETICGLGIRVSELSLITLEAVEHGEAVITCKGKTRKILLVSKLKKKLLRYAKKQKITAGSIFVTRNGKPLDRSNIWREMKKLSLETKVSKEKVFPHNFRHLFAREFYRIDKDIAKLADLLGHTSINTTRIYIISTGAEHLKEMEKMKLIA